jgi:hypothetical protein
LESSKFVWAFSQLFDSLKGFPLRMTKDNCFYFKVLSNAIGNAELFEFCHNVVLSNQNDFTPMELLQQYPCDTFPAFAPIYDEVASKFHTFEFSKLSALSVLHLGFIFGNGNLCIKSEDSLFDFLNFYRSNRFDNEGVFSLFGFIHFPKLSFEHLKAFFSSFPLPLISSSIWDSLPNLSPNPNFSVTNGRYAKPPHNETKFESLNDGSGGVFYYFRSKCSNRNPNNSEFLNVTPSSIHASEYPHSSVLEWNNSRK